MKRPSRSPNFGRTPWVWSHGNGLGHCVDPSNAPEHDHLYEHDCVPIDDMARDITEFEWRRLPNEHRLKIHNREYHQEDVPYTRESPRKDVRQVKLREVHTELIDDDEDAHEAASKMFELAEKKAQ